MNNNLAIYFNEDFLQAAVNPDIGKFQLLNKNTFPVYFLFDQGNISYGNYKTEFQKGHTKVKGDFYKSLLKNETFKHYGYEKNLIELLEPILEEIKELYIKSLSSLTHTDVRIQGDIPLITSFSDSIPAEAKQKVKNYLSIKGFSLIQDVGLAPSENLLIQKLVTDKKGIFEQGYYSILEALAEDLILSFVKIDQNKNVARQAVHIIKDFGNDPRIGALAKYAVDEANKVLYVLSGEALKKEYIRQLHNAWEWNDKLKGKNRYIKINVKLSLYPDDPVPVTLTKDKIEKLTITRSRHIASIFENHLRPLGIELERVVALGDSLDNEHFINEFKRFGKSELIILKSRQVSDILHGMLINPDKKEEVQIENLPASDIVNTKDLFPGDKVVLRWKPKREVTLMFEGSKSFMVIKSEKASIHVGDRFSIDQFQLYESAYIDKIERPTLPPDKTFRYQSGPLTYLSVLKK